MLPEFLRGLADANFYLMSRTDASMRIGAVDPEPLYPVDQNMTEPLYGCRILDLNVEKFNCFEDSEIQLKQGTYVDEILYVDNNLVLERD